MSRARRGIALALLGAALALPAPLAQARPHRIAHPATAAPADARAMPMRIVLGRGGERWSNCIFSTVELPEETPPDTRTRDSFQAGQQIWGRCYLPAPLGDGRVVDVITVDGKPGWEQAYPSAKGGSRTGGRSRSVAFSEVLRIQLAGLAAGPHRIVVEGSLRRGKRTTKLYEGEFRYVR